MINRFFEIAELVDVCERAIRTWGKSAQLRMAQEEASELSAAVSHYLRGRDPDGEELAGEIADVVITLVQAVSILGVERILPRIAEKIARLWDRIEEAERANEPT